MKVDYTKAGFYLELTLIGIIILTISIFWIIGLSNGINDRREQICGGSYKVIDGSTYCFEGNTLQLPNEQPNHSPQYLIASILFTFGFVFSGFNCVSLYETLRGK